jgi:release factor glutamine methyltransferase
MTSTTPPTAAEALHAASRRLQAAGLDTPRLDAEVLLRRLLGLDRTALFLRLQEPLTPEELDRFEALLARRLTGEPVAYLTGTREFMGLPFAVRPGVLIPRPETEAMVEWALAWLRQRPADAATTVLDIGTGSGAIILSLVHHRGRDRPGRFVGTDLSAAALAVAAENRERLGLTNRVQLVRGDLAAWCAGPVDLLLANLPYLRPDQIVANPALAAEPSLALAGGGDGLIPIRRLIADAPRVLHPAGALALEIDPSQETAVRNLASAALPDAAVDVHPDLAGHPRHLLARRGA